VSVTVAVDNVVVLHRRCCSKAVEIALRPNDPPTKRFLEAMDPFHDDTADLTRVAS